MRPPSNPVLSSGNLLADRRYEWARDCEAKGDLRGATDLLDQALELAPHYAPAWFLLGGIAEKLGDFDRAIAAYRRARDVDPDDRHGAALCLMRLGAVGMAEMPSGYVRALFDQYAPHFDEALLAGLGYRAPDLLREAVQSVHRGAGSPTRFRSMLDLGCGTGLAGEVFRPHVDRLTGVDLSPAMIAQAQRKAIYDRLEAAELRSFLAAEYAAGSVYDLIVAADVFVYVPDLVPVVSAAARILERDGILAFTIETHSGDSVILRDTLRFAHGEQHTRQSIAEAALTLLSLTQVSTRTEKEMPVSGLMALARQDRP